MDSLVATLGIVGIAFIALGVSFFAIQYVNELNCAQSRVPASCVNAESMRISVDYPLITIGLVLAACSVVSARLHKADMRKSE